MVGTAVHSGRTPRTLAILCAVTVAPAIGFAADSTPDFQYDPVEHWAARILTMVALLALAVIIVALIRARSGHLTGPTGKALLLSGVVFLPSFSVGTGMLLVFARAERIEFCGSCHHAMGDFVRDMEDPQSAGLASIHFQNQYIPTHPCYECHTSYGLFGTMEAKIHGVGQVMRYYTNSFEPPIQMWKPYGNADCLKCHARSAKWLAVESHTEEDTKVHIYEGRTSCMECHESGHKVNQSVEIDS